MPDNPAQQKYDSLCCSARWAKRKPGTEAGLARMSADHRHRRVATVTTDQLLTASFRPLPAVNFGTLRAGISTSAPVDGLRPLEASRRATVKAPKPARRMSPPFFSSAWTVSKTASTAEAASALVRPAFLGDRGYEFVLVHVSTLSDWYETTQMIKSGGEYESFCPSQLKSTRKPRKQAF